MLPTNQEEEGEFLFSHEHVHNGELYSLYFYSMLFE